MRNMSHIKQERRIVKDRVKRTVNNSESILNYELTCVLLTQVFSLENLRHMRK